MTFQLADTHTALDVTLGLVAVVERLEWYSAWCHESSGAILGYLILGRKLLLALTIGTLLSRCRIRYIILAWYNRLLELLAR